MTCLVPAVLHENQVPDLHYIGATLVHQCCRISATTHVVIVDFCAGTTGTCVPHLPEVILQWERKHVTGRNPGKANNRDDGAEAYTQTTQQPRSQRKLKERNPFFPLQTQ